jgi:hypothetical protein
MQITSDAGHARYGVWVQPWRELDGCRICLGTMDVAKPYARAEGTGGVMDIDKYISALSRLRKWAIPAGHWLYSLSPEPNLDHCSCCFVWDDGGRALDGLSGNPTVEDMEPEAIARSGVWRLVRLQSFAQLDDEVIAYVKGKVEILHRIQHLWSSESSDDSGADQ